MAIVKLSRVQHNLSEAIKSFNEVLSDCTPEELLGARVIAEILNDARLRMEQLEQRMRKRIDGGAAGS